MNPLILVRAALLVLVFGAVVFCAWAWRRGLATRPRVEPRWRGLLAVIGLALGSVSLLILLVSWLHATVRGGLPFNNPALLLYTRFGLITAVAGFLAALGGKGSSRVPASIISALMSLFWLAVVLG